MPQYYIEPQYCVAETFTLTGPEAEHAVRVMRIVPGAEITLFDGMGKKWRARVAETGRGELSGQIIEELPAPVARLRADLYFAPVSKAAVSELLDCCTQLGAHSFTPVLAARCEHKIADRFETKSESWRKTLIASCKQCGRADIPAVSAPVPFGQAVLSVGKGVIGLLTGNAVPLVDGIKRLELSAGESVAVFVGPEGGFTPDEEAAALRAGLVPVSLGVHTLRAETACIAACAVLCAA